MRDHTARRIVHLQLRSEEPSRACAFWANAFGWHAEIIHVGSASYLTLGGATGLEIGVVADESGRGGWLPYVEVADIDEATERVPRLGGAIVLAPREGPAGWRSVIVEPTGTEIGLWEPKP
jgi:predicted enzyme related to lactoylglutathione lyase